MDIFRRSLAFAAIAAIKVDRLSFLWGPAFVTQECVNAESLLGAPGDTLIPASGLVIVGGEGGSGKSTLTLHAIAHLASGVTGSVSPSLARSASA